MWKVIYRPAALKILRRLDTNIADRIIRKVEELAKDPHTPNNNAKKLKGEEGYRLRVGDWRVIYTLQHNLLIVSVVRIGPRGSVYDE